ncbi:TIGR04104 family putative zinc finger protein [Paraliobacillus zengyii]|uniref:TIGR04104 family putative zinc finger protein n=1 Tax=Paraliobacillus zengyii TaxID=2213194 RepID=UPI000E3DBBFD|nr:TIGR04104 family putative zinc finger protein [Paraliobacillus zengyii]
MPTCKNCNKEWSWKQTFKKMFTLDIAMKCPHCGKKQYYTKRARKRSTAIVFITPFMFLLNMFGISLFLSIGIFLVYCILILVIYPFLIELSNKEEFLW